MLSRNGKFPDFEYSIAKETVLKVLEGVNEHKVIAEMFIETKSNCSELVHQEVVEEVFVDYPILDVESLYDFLENLVDGFKIKAEDNTWGKSGIICINRENFAKKFINYIRENKSLILEQAKKSKFGVPNVHNIQNVSVELVNTFSFYTTVLRDKKLANLLKE